MKSFELMYLCTEPLLFPLYRKVRKRLLRVVRGFPYRPNVLDVGGRKSHYTVGVPANITITDIPRETEIQKRLRLGINQEIIDNTQARRSNLHKILLDDMTQSSLPDRSFECVVAVEVLEHVELDAQFVGEVYRVLKPGGVFLMTTPNGDFLKKIINPDHKRHYTREQLRQLLSSNFEDVEVEYAIRGGAFYIYGLEPLSISNPWRTVLSITGKVVNAIQCARKKLRDQAQGTLNLIAIARKQP